MTCRELNDFLVDYLSDTLSPAVRAAFDRHLEICPNCRAFLATYRATIAMSWRAFDEPDAEASTVAPDDLVAGIIEACRREGR